MEGPVSALLVLDCSRLCCALCSEDYLIFFFIYFTFFLLSEMEEMED